MNVKISIELSEQQLEFAERLVSQGAYASISDLVQDQIRDLMLGADDIDGEPDPVAAMADEIRRRTELPDDQWIPVGESDSLFEDLRSHARKKLKAGF
jgi:antitoxin ParD1/3/4